MSLVAMFIHWISLILQVLVQRSVRFMGTYATNQKVYLLDQQIHVVDTRVLLQISNDLLILHLRAQNLMLS